MKIGIMPLTLPVSLLIVVNALIQKMLLVYGVENTAANCPRPPLPSVGKLPNAKTLPDPFEWADGRGRISSKADRRCRPAEIADEIQHYEPCNKPASPDSQKVYFSAAYSILTVKVAVNLNTLILIPKIDLHNGNASFPAAIGIGFGATGSLPPDIFIDRSIATIRFNFDLIALVFPGRGKEAFYKLYPDPERETLRNAQGVARNSQDLTQFKNTVKKNAVDKIRFVSYS